MGLAACDTGRLQSPTTEHATVSHTTGRANLPSDHHVNGRYMQYPHCNALIHIRYTHLVWYFSYQETYIEISDIKHQGQSYKEGTQTRPYDVKH